MKYLACSYISTTFGPLFADSADGGFPEGPMQSYEGPREENTSRAFTDKKLRRGGFWIRLLAFTIDLFCIGLTETVFSWSITLGTITGARLLEMSPEAILDVRQFLSMPGCLRQYCPCRNLLYQPKIYCLKVPGLIIHVKGNYS